MASNARFAIEAREAAEGARRQRAACGDTFAELGRRLAASPPPFVVTCARGSSDHAATYGKYVIETRADRIVASVGPSVASLYRAHQRLDGALFIAVSQSGRSPDLLELTEAARRAGALVVGFVNDATSPLAAACEIAIPLCAGEERAVAATKSYLLASFAFLQLVAAWTTDPSLASAVARFPDALDEACATPWDLAWLARASSAYAIARGCGLGAALEIALKLKETCGLHAEAFSTAEVLHGPVALVTRDFPIVALAQDDETRASTLSTVERLRAIGADVHLVDSIEPAIIAPLCHVQSFYAGLPALAAARGRDVDAPPHLAKITSTR